MIRSGNSPKESDFRDRGAYTNCRFRWPSKYYRRDRGYQVKQLGHCRRRLPGHRRSMRRNGRRNELRYIQHAFSLLIRVLYSIYAPSLNPFCGSRLCGLRFLRFTHALFTVQLFVLLFLKFLTLPICPMLHLFMRNSPMLPTRWLSSASQCVCKGASEAVFALDILQEHC